MSRGTVLVSAATAARAVPYVAALAAAGVAAESIRVIAAGSADSAGAAGAATAAAGEGAGPPAAAVASPLSGGEVAELAAGAAGLVLCGGEDVETGRYGEEPLPGAGVEAAPRRDALEWELLAAARSRRLPVWGICRGFQVLNVFFGGSLWQDLPLQRPATSEHPEHRKHRKHRNHRNIVAHDLGRPHDRLAHAIRVLAPDAPLGRRLAAAGPAPLVNSRHHQGVRRLGAGLLAVAAAADGLIEAAVLVGGAGLAEDAEEAGEAGWIGRTGDGWWVRGVEWHPENLLALPEQMALWHDFAAAVAGCAAASAGGPQRRL